MDRNAANACRLTLPARVREHLVALRRDKGIRVKVLARVIGISPSELQKWQNGERRPTPEQLAAWRGALDGGMKTTT